VTATPRIACVVGTGGIGSALLDRFAADAAFDRVIAVSRRRPDGWARDWIGADILQENSLAAAAEQLAGFGTPRRIVVATGRLHAPEKSMRALSLDGMAQAFAVNAAGPALVAKHFLPLTPRTEPSLFAAISARVGSIGDNQLGGWYAYRASKAALNMLIRTLAIEHRRTRPLSLCVALHPGSVDTNLSAPFHSGVPQGKLFTPERSAEALASVMDRLEPADNGGFFAWDGTRIPW
jgi:NAD(P)-dependent dehydrogenase (short-subunit alcohol dehydrogenase family)